MSYNPQVYTSIDSFDIAEMKSRYEKVVLFKLNSVFNIYEEIEKPDFNLIEQKAVNYCKVKENGLKIPAELLTTNCSIYTLHTYGHEILFKPSLDEILAQSPEDWFEDGFQPYLTVDIADFFPFRQAKATDRPSWTRLYHAGKTRLLAKLADRREQAKLLKKVQNEAPKKKSKQSTEVIDLTKDG